MKKMVLWVFCAALFSTQFTPAMAEHERDISHLFAQREEQICDKMIRDIRANPSRTRESVLNELKDSYISAPVRIGKVIRVYDSQAMDAVHPLKLGEMVKIYGMTKIGFVRYIFPSGSVAVQFPEDGEHLRTFARHDALRIVQKAGDFSVGDKVSTRRFFNTYTGTISYIFEHDTIAVSMDGYPNKLYFYSPLELRKQ